MDEKLYNLCDWAEIEAIVYSEHDNPHKILGPHVTEDGIMISTFMPTAVSVMLKPDKTEKEYEMEMVDESGYFSVLIQGKKIPSYTFLYTFDNGTTMEVRDPYAFEPVIDAMDMKKFESGSHYTIYEKMGAHPMTINGVEGVLFAVWAPNAIRVSVVGDFNLWDGRKHPMRRLGDSGIFEVFIPGIKAGEIYKYELKVKGGLVILKTDPYGNYAELRPATASVVYDIEQYSWKDKTWMNKRKKSNFEKEPMSIYEVHLGSWRKPEEEERDFYNYRELAPMLAEYVKEMGYTHIELMPVMEYPLDESWGYQVTGYYAPTSRYGTPEDFMYFMDYMHQKNIGVILDWVPAHFPRDTFGMSNFDGTCLYEHQDPRQGSHPHWGTLIYNYGRPQVANFLIANALFWVEKYHADAIRMDAVASMLYLDYGKKDGEWIPNIYGGNENLEAIELIKQLSTAFNQRKDGSLLIAEESTAWPKVTTDVEDDGLGFALKWNMGWMNDFTEYMKCDPLFRKGRHGQLTFSMVYAYSEKFILVLSHDEVVHGKASMINKMPGDWALKFANLRAAYGFMTAHPGKKLIFMGQDIAQITEWNETESIHWELLDKQEHMQMKEYVKALNRLYQDYPAFYEMDYDSDGFEWINDMDAERSIISFLRKTDRPEETLLVVCNFTPVVYEDFKVGVPFKGKYKETFNSDKEIFGGAGNVNPRLKQSKNEEWDERENSISITVPPLGISVFTCTPASETAKKTTKKTTTKKAAEKKTTAKKTTVKKVTSAAETKPVETAEKAAEEKKIKASEKPEEKKATSSAKKPEEKKEKAPAKKAEEMKTETSAKKAEEKKTAAPAAKKAEEKKTETPAKKAEEKKTAAPAAKKAAEKKAKTPVKKAAEKKAETPAKKAVEKKAEEKKTETSEKKPE